MADVKNDAGDDKDVAGMVGGAFAGGAVGGIAGGAMAGAAAGGLGGPAGATIGAALGAVAGMVTGKVIADRIDPQTEDRHWRSSYASRPYVPAGSRFEDYEPAYKLGYERYPDFHGQSFEQAEADLQQDWESRRGASPLGWNEARHASRDAFNRARDSVAAEPATYDSVETHPEVSANLDKLLRGELAATETYRQGLDKIRDEFGNDAAFQALAAIQSDHERAAGELRQLIARSGGNPSSDAGLWGTWSSTVMGAARILGDRAALNALAKGEQSGLDDYQDILKDDRTPDPVRHALRLFLARNQQHIQQLEQMLQRL